MQQASSMINYFSIISSKIAPSATRRRRLYKRSQYCCPDIILENMDNSKIQLMFTVANSKCYLGPIKDDNRLFNIYVTLDGTTENEKRVSII